MLEFWQNQKIMLLLSIKKHSRGLQEFQTTKAKPTPDLKSEDGKKLDLGSTSRDLKSEDGKKLDLGSTTSTLIYLILFS